MTLTEKINEDLKAAMKAGDSIRLNTIRSIRARIVDLSKRGTGSAITTEDELAVLMTAAKQRKESIEMFEKGGRKDLVAQEQKELEIISTYLPKPLTKEEALHAVTRIIKETGATTSKDVGKVMSVAMKELKGKVDGSVVQELVKQQLVGTQ